MWNFNKNKDNNIKHKYKLILTRIYQVFGYSFAFLGFIATLIVKGFHVQMLPFILIGAITFITSRASLIELKKTELKSN